MAQFDVHRAVGSSRPPYFIVLQSDLLRAADTVIVAPLYLYPTAEDPIALVRRLHPVFDVADTRAVLMPTLMAAVRRSFLGARIGSLADRRDDIIAAIDLLFTGV